MRNLNACSILLLFAMVLIKECTTAEEKSVDYPISPVDFTHVKLTDGYWKGWVKLASETTIPFSLKKCEETGRIDNFIFAGGIKEGKFNGRYGFNDSDLYKIIEGASYSLSLAGNPGLEAYLDTLLFYISEAQEEDGYLYTAWSLKANKYNDFACCTYSDQGRWIGTPGSSHEFYNAGHMYEAAVAHYLATGKRTFLDVAVKNADLVYDVCITQGNDYVPGHQEIEIGLVKLYRVTGDGKYLLLAKHLLDIRADAHDGDYSQAHLPVTEQSEAVGHAVRANYMYSAMADVAALTDDSAYVSAIGRIWDNVVQKKLSVTGGVGASHRGEAYGENYDLPNHPYNETCAAIANVYWNHRMFLLHGDGKYMDVLERALYNGVMSGLSLDGIHFFYPNTLQHDGEATFNQGVNGRSPWFDCSCCPSNLSRFVPSVAGYAYATRGEELFVNLYMNSEVSVQISGGKLSISQQSNYPWDGSVRMEFRNEREVEATIHFRVPGFARNQPVPSDLFEFADERSEEPLLHVNNKRIEIKTEQGYLSVTRKWKRGDVVTLDLPMEVRLLTGHKKVGAKKGLTAVQCGPIIYCAEEIDNSQDVLEARINENPGFIVHYKPGLLGGVNMLEGGGLTMIPYYAWANREIGKMNVWFKSN